MNPINNGGRPPSGAASAGGASVTTKATSPHARRLPAGMPFHASAATAAIVSRLTLSAHNTGGRPSSPVGPADKQLANALQDCRAYLRQQRKRAGDAD